MHVWFHLIRAIEQDGQSKCLLTGTAVLPQDVYKFNQANFREIPGGLLNSSTFPGFPGVVDTLSLCALACRLARQVVAVGTDSFPTPVDVLLLNQLQSNHHTQITTNNHNNSNNNIVGSSSQQNESTVEANHGMHSNTVHKFSG